MRRLVRRMVFVALLLSLATACLAQAAAPTVELHGYMQNRFYTNPSMSARFVTERISLSAVGKLADNATGYMEVYIHPWLTDQVVSNGLTTVPVSPAGTNITAEQSRVYLESAYVDMPLGPGRIRIGKGRQLNFGLTPTYPNRKTSQYGILSETFTQDRIVGFQWSAKSGLIDGGVSLFSDQDLGTRNVGDTAGAISRVDSQPHLCDRDNPANISGKMAISGKIGFTNPMIQGHLSAAAGQLNRNQLVPVNPFVPAGAPANTNTTHNKFGADGSLTFGSLVGQAEWYTGKFSLVGVTGYQLLVGWQPKDKPRFALRWAAINYDKGVTANQVTWPVQQFTAAFVIPIRKGVWVEVNYEKNMTSNPAGTTAPKDDVLFTEFFTGF